MESQERLPFYLWFAVLRGLDDMTATRFSKYMTARWPILEEAVRHVIVGYADEWASRFRGRGEYGASDIEGQAILAAIDVPSLGA